MNGNILFGDRKCQYYRKSGGDLNARRSIVSGRLRSNISQLDETFS